MSAFQIDADLLLGRRSYPQHEVPKPEPLPNVSAAGDAEVVATGLVAPALAALLVTA